eukprot:m.106069 g.106069  ORF g.106069 m.106069 type:complete len:136 (+) comp16889_c0_seq10:286-693(+)
MDSLDMYQALSHFYYFCLATVSASKTQFHTAVEYSLRLLFLHRRSYYVSSLHVIIDVNTILCQRFFQATFFCCHRGDIEFFDRMSKDCTKTTKSHAELGSFRRPIADDFNFDAKVSVVLCEPLHQRTCVEDGGQR